MEIENNFKIFYYQVLMAKFFEQNKYHEIATLNSLKPTVKN